MRLTIFWRIMWCSRTAFKTVGISGSFETFARRKVLWTLSGVWVFALSFVRKYSYPSLRVYEISVFPLCVNRALALHCIAYIKLLLTTILFAYRYPCIRPTVHIPGSIWGLIRCYSSEFQLFTRHQLFSRHPWYQQWDSSHYNGKHLITPLKV